MKVPSPEAPFTKEQASHIFTTLVGEFHLSFTALEHELSCVVFAAVTRLSSKRRDVLLAVLGDQRMAQLKETIKRLMRATKATEKRQGFVDAFFLQVGEIQFFRNRLSHYLTVMSDYNPECWVNMNFTGISEREKMEDLHFNLFAIKAASLDLQEMRPLVALFFNHYLRSGSTRLPQLPSWQYKPSMLVRDHPISSESRRQRKRPPQSSQEKVRQAKLAGKEAQRRDPKNRKREK
jgi:hypothetical protein